MAQLAQPTCFWSPAGEPKAAVTLLEHAGVLQPPYLGSVAAATADLLLSAGQVTPVMLSMLF